MTKKRLTALSKTPATSSTMLKCDKLKIQKNLGTNMTSQSGLALSGRNTFILMSNQRKEPLQNSKTSPILTEASIGPFLSK